MYYDDGYEELLKEEELGKFEDETLGLPKVRAHKLSNGDVLQVNDLLLEFENNLLYEVKPSLEAVNPYYERTGRTYTPELLNKMLSNNI